MVRDFFFSLPRGEISEVHNTFNFPYIVYHRNTAIPKTGDSEQKGIMSVFQKREIGTVYPRQAELTSFTLDLTMGEPTKLRIGYAEVICYKFGLLDI
jgi:hypothetical protein